MSPKDFHPELSALKKDLNKKFYGKNVDKFKFFTDGPENLPGIPDWFENAVFVSLDAEWWNLHREPAPPTELGFAVLYAQEIIDFTKDPNYTLEDLFAKIKACHVRVIENSHMINRGDWLNDKTEEAFLFGTTGFLTAEEAKDLAVTLMTESTWRESGGTERRPIILVGQGIYKDNKALKRAWKLDLHKMEILDMIEARWIAIDAGITQDLPGMKSLQYLVEGFGLTPSEDLYLHDAGNDAVVTLIVSLLGGLNHHLHPDTLGGFPSDVVQGRHMRDIVKAAAPRIKAGSVWNWGITTFCHRCGSRDHMVDGCNIQFEPCQNCGSTDHLVVRCLASVMRDPCENCGSREHDVKWCQTGMELD